MEISTDPNDPEFREALRKLGAPEWYPQEALTHEIDITRDGLVINLICPICRWHKTYKDGNMTTLHRGEPWAFHHGGNGIKIRSVTVATFGDLKPFEDFINTLGDNNE